MDLIHTTDFHEVGEKVAIVWTPEDVHIMEKMEW